MKKFEKYGHTLCMFSFNGFIFRIYRPNWSVSALFWMLQLRKYFELYRTSPPAPSLALTQILGTQVLCDPNVMSSFLDIVFLGAELIYERACPSVPNVFIVCLISSKITVIELFCVTKMFVCLICIRLMRFVLRLYGQFVLVFQ